MKLVSINELTHLLGMQRETIRKRLAGLTPVDGPQQAKLYDSKQAIHAILGLTKDGDTAIDYNEAQKQLAVARKQQIDLEMEVTRKERPRREEVLNAFAQLCGKMAEIVRSAPGIADDARADLLTSLREFLDRLEGM
jgi:hypothetical protein